jgi:hypothetical protein
LTFSAFQAANPDKYMLTVDAEAEFMKPTPKANQIIRAYYKSIGRLE